MTDEQPVDPTQPVPADAAAENYIKLENLPPAAREALDQMVKEGFGSRKIKSELETQFGEIPDIIPASRDTYQRYIDKHYDRLEAEKAFESTALGKLEDIEAANRKVIEAAKKPNPQSYLEALEELTRTSLARTEWIEQQQSKGLPSAQWENALANSIRNTFSLIEKTAEIRGIVEKQEANKWVDYFVGTSGELLNKVINVYKKYHGEKFLIEFHTDISASLSDILQARLLEIEKTDEPKTNQDNS